VATVRHLRYSTGASRGIGRGIAIVLARAAATTVQRRLQPNCERAG
jgi:NAD(P)-dependent dehydrogenase (short-subunit alcohol dehydrogenase family)